MVQSNGNNALSDALVRHGARQYPRLRAMRTVELKKRVLTAVDRPRCFGVSVTGGTPTAGLLLENRMNMMKKCTIKMGTPF